MEITLQTRKPVEALTRENLDASTIWEFATGEEGDDLGKPPAGIYPLRFTLRATLDGEAAPRSGIFA